jgi:hypothetical protein
VQSTRKALNAGTGGSTFLEHLDAIGGDVMGYVADGVTTALKPLC